MLFRCREAQLTFWHVNLALYTEGKVHTLQPLRVTAQDVRAWATSVPATCLKEGTKMLCFLGGLKLMLPKPFQY